MKKGEYINSSKSQMELSIFLIIILIILGVLLLYLLSGFICGVLCRCNNIVSVDRMVIDSTIYSDSDSDVLNREVITIIDVKNVKIMETDDIINGYLPEATIV